MKTNVTFKAFPFPPARFIGKACTAVTGRKNPVIKELWDDFLYKGGKEFLEQRPDIRSPKGDCAGWMGEYNAQTKEFTYIVGSFFEPGCDVPEGYTYRDVPACLMGVGKIRGKTQHLEGGAHNKTVKAMQADGYEPDYSVGFSMEYYPYEQYGMVEDNGENELEFHYYLPCRKKASADKETKV